MDYLNSMLLGDPFASDEERLRREIALNARSALLPRARKRISVGDAITNDVRPGQSGTMLPLTTQGKADLFTQMGLDAYAAEPDVTGLQQYARQRGQEGERDMLRALAAQYAGERFEPVQAQFLKRAIAAQEPLKVGNAGYITPSGEYVKDPTYAQDRQAEKYLQMGQLYSNQASREEQAVAERANRYAMAGLRSIGNEGANDARLWRAEDTLRNNFETSTKPERETLAQVNSIVGLINRGNTTGIDQQAIAILLQKFLDPNSVVREAEFERAAQSQGLFARAETILTQAKNGQFLTPETLNDIRALANFYRTASEGSLRKRANQFATVARQRGLDVNAVILDPSFLGGASAAAAPSGPETYNGLPVIKLPSPGK